MSLKLVSYNPGSCLRCGGADGYEIGVGESVKIYLNQERNSDFQEYIPGIVTAVDQASLTDTTRTYTVQYESDSLPDNITELQECDISSLICESCCDILQERMDNLTNGLFNVLDYGATGDGETDDTVAFQNAASAAADYNLLIPPGNYVITDTVVTQGNIEGTGATLICTGTGPFLQVGNGAANNHRIMNLPAVIRGTGGTDPDGVWDDGSIGVDIVNLIRCEVRLPQVQGFNTGIRIRGQGTGTVDNILKLGKIRNNKISLHVTADSTGWCNQNMVLGGVIDHTSFYSAGTSGCKAILMDNTTNQVNGWTFYAVNFEYKVFEYWIESYGLRCLWDWCRWESGSVGDPPTVYWRTGSAANVIRGGYGSTTIVPVFEASNLYDNVLETTRKRMINSADPGGPFWLQNASSTSPCISLFEGTNDIAAKTAGAYGAAMGSRVFGFKAVADAFDRLQIECPTGAIYTGDGVAEPGSAYYRLAIQSTRILAKLLADAQPRINISASDGAIFFGDGTVDPTAAYIKGAGTDRLQFWSNGQLCAECSTDGDFHVYATTDTASSSTGALVVEGGVGVVGNMRVGGTLRTTGIFFPIGGIGMGNTPSANNPFRIDVSGTNTGTYIDIANTNTGNAAYAGFQFQSDAGSGLLRMHSLANASYAGRFALLAPSTANGVTVNALGTGKTVALGTNNITRLSIGDATFTFAAVDFVFDTSTGTKIGSAANQKIAFYGSTPVVQPTAVADASGGATIDAEARTALNALLARLRTLGIIAT